jgi:hypothetical protein
MNRIKTEAATDLLAWHAGVLEAASKGPSSDLNDSEDVSRFIGIQHLRVSLKGSDLGATS